MIKITKSQLIRAAYATLGVLILGFGATILREGHVGMDPYTSANIAISGMLGLSLGVYQLGLNLVFLLLIFLFGRKYIGFGTVVNMVFTGFFIDMFTALFEKVGIQAETLPMKLLFLVVGTVIFTFAVSLYTGANLGAAPYDACAPTIVDHTGWPYRVVRIIQDVSFTLLGFFLGGPVGVGTFINAFLTGPLITFWNDNVAGPLIAKSLAAAEKSNG